MRKFDLHPEQMPFAAAAAKKAKKAAKAYIRAEAVLRDAWKLERAWLNTYANVEGLIGRYLGTNTVDDNKHILGKLFLLGRVCRGSPKPQVSARRLTNAGKAPKNQRIRPYLLRLENFLIVGEHVKNPDGSTKVVFYETKK